MDYLDSRRLFNELVFELLDCCMRLIRSLAITAAGMSLLLRRTGGPQSACSRDYFMRLIRWTVTSNYIHAGGMSLLLRWMGGSAICSRDYCVY